MKIRFTTHQATPEGNYKPGDEVQLQDEGLAQALIGAGAAEAVIDEAPPEDAGA